MTALLFHFLAAWVDGTDGKRTAGPCRPLGLINIRVLLYFSELIPEKWSPSLVSKLLCCSKIHLENPPEWVNAFCHSTLRAGHAFFISRKHLSIREVIWKQADLPIRRVLLHNCSKFLPHLLCLWVYRCILRLWFEREEFDITEILNYPSSFAGLLTMDVHGCFYLMFLGGIFSLLRARVKEQG